MLLPKRRKVVEGKTVRLVSECNELNYNCTFYVSSEAKLQVNVQIPEGFEKAAVNPVTFSDFEDLLLSYDKISSLELFLKQLKSINSESVCLVESPRLEITLVKMVNGSYVLYRKILEKNSKRLEYVQPTDYGIMAVYRDKSWEVYDEERNFQIFCSERGEGDVEIVCKTDAYNSILSKVDCFREIAKTIYKQNF